LEIRFRGDLFRILKASNPNDGRLAKEVVNWLMDTGLLPEYGLARRLQLDTGRLHLGQEEDELGGEELGGEELGEEELGEEDPGEEGPGPPPSSLGLGGGGSGG
jgi:hypothetical protein